MLCRRSPNLPHTYACSTIGPARLNFRVRDGNGWDPRGMVTGKLERRLAGGFPRGRVSSGQILQGRNAADWRHNLRRLAGVSSPSPKSRA